jgi:hypothetical protein
MKSSHLTNFLVLRAVSATVGALALFLGQAQAADYPTTVLNDNPVVYYRMEDANGSSMITDSSTNNYPGYVTYATQADGITTYPQLGVAGVDTHSALFATSTGISQGHIDVPVAGTLINPTLADGQTGAPFTAELWVQATTGSTANFEVPLDDSQDFSQPPPYNNSAGWNFYQTQGPGSTWAYSVRPNPGFVGYGTAAVVLGQWAHLVLSYDGTNASFYVNGTLSRKDPIAQYLANTGHNDMEIGEGPATGFAPFDGYIDEVAIYNYPLSAAQVANHYAIGTNEIVAPPTPPTFAIEPASTNAYAGVPVTFTSQALGTAPLSYQWVRVGSGPIAGATNNNYTLTPAYPADNNATFYVTVTNSAGTTNSTNAVLTVLTNLNFIAQPFSITRRVGSHAAFRVAANGAQPITYQWHVVSNSVDHVITGATADTLWLTNIQMSYSGNSYYVQVTGPFVASPSSSATLTVVPRTMFAKSNAYSTVVLSDNPVAFWRLDESTGATNALDDAGSFDGAYSAPSGTLTFGYPSGVPRDNDTGIHVTNTAIVTIPYALELNPVTTPWSYEFWIQPTSLDPVNFHAPISSEYNPSMGVSLTGWNIYQHVAGVWTWNIYNGGSGGSFTSEFTDNPIVPGKWYHMVLTDDTTNMVWYSNDRLVFSTTTSAVGFVQNGINGDPSVAGGPITLAERSDGVFGDWDGGMQDVAVYNYVLSPQQIQNHFLNSTTLTITQSGTNIIVTWGAGTLVSSTTLNGSYSPVMGATSPYTTSAAVGGKTFYKAQLQ